MLENNSSGFWEIFLTSENYEVKSWCLNLSNPAVGKELGKVMHSLADCGRTDI